MGCKFDLSFMIQHASSANNYHLHVNVRTNVASRIRYVFARLQSLSDCVILFDEIEEFCLDRETPGLVSYLIERCYWSFQ